MTAPDQPLHPELLDELLSADLDGEFDRGAADLGFTPEEARAAVDSAPGAGPRRAALAQARDQLGTPPRLAPTDEQRLVAAALDHAADDLRRARDRRAQRRFERSRRVLVAVGSAAAAIAVIVGVSAIGPGNDGSKSSSDSAAPVAADRTAPETGTPRPAGSIAFGDVSQAGALSGKVAAALNRPPTEAAADNATRTSTSGISQGGLTASSGFPNPAPTVPVSGEASPRELAGDGTFSLAPQQVICIAAGARAAKVRQPPVVTGTATYQGRPAIVVVFRQAQSYVAYLLAVPGCTVIERITVP